MTGEITKPKRSFSGMQVLGMVLASMCIAILATGIVLKLYLFPAPFKPVELSQKESQHLAEKLERFENFSHHSAPEDKDFAKDGTLIPEAYNEGGASRDIKFTERELNAMVAKNTDLAEKLAIDLAEEMISIKLLIPLDPDFPILGGKTLKVKAGAELAYRNGRPVIKLKGVSLMGVPVPNAWLGGIKNIDLIKEFGTEEGFWKTFADGVDSVSVVEGFLKIRLKE
ncbi:MAG: arginine N-succinyltransferase [Desulforhopalus sp.]